MESHCLHFAYSEMAIPELFLTEVGYYYCKLEVLLSQKEYLCTSECTQKFVFFKLNFNRIQRIPL